MQVENKQIDNKSTMRVVYPVMGSFLPTTMEAILNNYKLNTTDTIDHMQKNTIENLENSVFSSRYLQIFRIDPRCLVLRSVV